MNLSSGQYRKVTYSNDGCCIYQCLWCMGTVECRDDPNYGWNFCPKCGKSWFKRKQCRDQGTPRWVYERWENSPPVNQDVHPWNPPKRQWVVRVRNYRDIWIHRFALDFSLGSWNRLLPMLKLEKEVHSSLQYRVTIEDIP